MYRSPSLAGTCLSSSLTLSSPRPQIGSRTTMLHRSCSGKQRTQLALSERTSCSTDFADKYHDALISEISHVCRPPETYRRAATSKLLRPHAFTLPTHNHPGRHVTSRPVPKAYTQMRLSFRPGIVVGFYILHVEAGE